MAITVTDNRVIADTADTTTGWSSPVGGNAPTQYTSAPDPKELTAHNGVQVSNTESELLFTMGTGVDMSAGTLVYIWGLAQGIMNTKALYGVASVIGDGTNTNAYQVGGSDAAVFRHGSGSGVNYQCLLIDTGSFPTGKALRGTLGSLVTTAITELGVNFFTLVKAVGGTENCWVDKVLYGNGGLTITVTDTASGFLDDLSVLDAAGTSGGSYGGCRALGGGVYGVQIKLLLGDAVGTGSDTLSVVSQTLKFENFAGIGTDKLGIIIQGNATGTQTIAFTDSTLFSPIGSGAFLTATDINVESFDMTGCLIQNFDQGINLSADATNAPNHDISLNNFVGCSQINSGATAFVNNTINSTTDLNGGWIIDANTSMASVSGLDFISDGTGHAIYITATGSYTFTDFTYSGYGATASTDAVIYNNSGGAVTVTVSGGDTPTYRNGTSASTTIVSGAVTLTVTASQSDGTAIENARVMLKASDGTGAFPFEEVVTITNSGTTATVAHTAHGMATNDYAAFDRASLAANNGVFQITVVDVDSYTYTMGSTPGTNPTGTIISTFVALYGLSDINGQVTTSRVYSVAQPVIGWTRKSTTTPFYKEGILTGSVSTTLGYISTAVMISDE